MVSNVEEVLKKHGWYVSSAKIDELLSEEEHSNNNNNNVDYLVKALLDLDLNAVGLQSKSESNGVNKQKAETLSGPLVLQVQKVRNVSAPKANETSHTAPQLMKVTVTDGCCTYQILQIGKWNTISLDTPPGTKMLLKSGNTCKVVCGFLPLKQNQFSIIGGAVAGLVEKWQMTKVYGLSNRQRDSRAPKWVPFGQKISNVDMKGSTHGFRSLEPESKQGKENEAFDHQRQANIEEVAKTFDVRKKSFAKSKPPVGEPVVDRQQRRSDQHSAGAANRPPRNDAPSEPSNRGRHDKKPNYKREEGEDLPVPSAPSKPTTLFDFVTNKLGEGEGPKDVNLSSIIRESSQNDYPSRQRGERPGTERRGSGRGTSGPPRPDVYGGKHNQQDGHFSSYNPREDHSRPVFQNGDKVLAKYWEDQKMHRAMITALGETGRTCVVCFVDYDNYEEVLLTDVQGCAPHKWENFRPGGPPRPSGAPRHQQQQQQQGGGGRRDDGPGRPPAGRGRAFDDGGNLNQHFSGTFEFRRGGNKPYVRGGRGPDARPDRQFYQPPRQRRD